MEKLPPKNEIDAAERSRIFHEQYGDTFDAASALPELVIAAGDFLSLIVGPADADAGMAKMVGGLAAAAGREISSPSHWRATLLESRSYCYSEWQIGAPLHDLAAYAEFGIVLHESEDPVELAAHIEKLLKQAQELEERTPTQEWRLSEKNELSRLVKIASSRWALDNDATVDPTALAYFGGVSEGRIRNMMSGPSRTFTSVDGRIPAREAQKWLDGRPEFWNSIWREQSLPQYDDNRREPVRQALFVPVARDGSIFHPGLRRGEGYTVGRKGSETQIADFTAALAELQRMPIPYWRRPNASGNWGSVAGIRWERVDGTKLD
ncbi:hypothetical protein JQ615_21510 [Bradyrhizobium jicamae]|uniref:Uncharacterized protein n=1 Tax=Bradyrhizobium jicamae TaxID=280332 RepID=A0ABS5FNQ9_9BRAD|nr:hypothetical protein [Bradyrhizobium jicamae]MBR0797971.1 hypothetical protein [Bradyrhizobium jicamae]